MACPYNAGNISYITQAFNGTGPFEVVQCQYVLTVGSVVFALFVFGTLGIMYYTSDGSFVVPIVLAVMLGGVIMTEMPAGFVQISALVFVMMGTIAILYMIHRARQND